MTLEYICLKCGETNLEIKGFKHECDPCLIGKQWIPTKWDSFCLWFWGLDLSAILAISGGLAVSGVFVHHFHYGDYESIIHALGFGLLLGRIIRYEK